MRFKAKVLMFPPGSGKSKFLSLSSCECVVEEIENTDGEEFFSWSYPGGLLERMYHLGHLEGEYEVIGDLEVVYSCDYWGEWDTDLTWDIKVNKIA